MVNKIIKLSILTGLSIGLALLVQSYEEPDPYLLKALYSAIALAVLYLVFKFFFEEAVVRHMPEPATRYSYRRALSAFFFVASLIALINIWVDAQNLVVAFGLVGAGVALALQDFFKNVAGGLVIFIRGAYQVGDRIEINSKKGDVIDIDLLNTTLLEIGEWVSGDQPTGRICTIPNGLVLSQSLHNYTRDHRFIWDEITIPITYDSDWRAASDLILKLVTTETENVTVEAQKSISRMSSRYYLPERAEVPYVFVTLTDNWVDFTVRYVTDARARRLVKDNLNRLILAEIEREERVRIASTTLSVTLKETKIANESKSKGAL